ncbi:hypothetical protein B0H17DRAFT_1213920 [Mycena rosella]|uniref:Uncharacterized protein n=1 Tax=Mycena rosella TaxID=1033263 RepID=A0AAD7CPV2_MYCRO|nr:hypothetical protein B0H17DRAFT_1213920 [Mycena rosella]
MSHVPAVLVELLLAFVVSSSAIFALLRLAAVPFPLFAVLQITFVWTLVVFVALRAGEGPIEFESAL